MKEAGIDITFVQDNQSMSVKGVLRGLHFQKQFPQTKLVRAIRGAVFDVAVDLRSGSKTFGKWYGVELTEENKKQFLIPRGFAHGFLVLSDTAEFVYKCDDFYHANDEGGLAWNDPEIGIDWAGCGVCGEYGGTASGDGYIYSELMPTPCLSYAVRALHCAAGIMVTASHNPSEYNGYKVYGADGCQITTEAAKTILAEIEKLDIFADVKTGSFEQGLESCAIEYISDDIYTAFVGEVKKQSVLSENDQIDKNVAVVYSPLHGTGLKPVLRTLNESGYTNITVVREQEEPDGNFTTCPYPNPEIKEAMSLGMEYAERYNADLLLATDPDCDRVGIAVKTPDGEYRLLSGNETGMLLLDYICRKRTENGTMPQNPVFIKTIVTTDLAERIAAAYGVRTVNVLTGFKFIGEQIGLLEQQGKESSYIFGMEESYGYLSGGYVRDKDAVDGAFLICEMFAYYQTLGISLIDMLESLYKEYGYCLNTLHSYRFEGSKGFAKMQEIMRACRERISAIGGKKVVKVLDYAQGLDGLPKSDVLKFLLEDNCSVVVRPSGTEPKLKIYLSVTGVSMQEAGDTERILVQDMDKYFA